MFSLSAYLKVYLHREPIDFRAGINSLAVLVQEVMELDPFVPAVFGMGKRGAKNDQIRAVRTSSQMSFNEPAKSGLGADLLAIFDHLDREAAGKPEGPPINAGAEAWRGTCGG
jgi:hypothetical protein